MNIAYSIRQKIRGNKKFQVLIWVDILISASSHEQKMEYLKTTFEGKFRFDDRGELEWFLGTPIEKTENVITLD